MLIGDVENFPKYTTQIMNLANQNAQGTRPKVVGQMSELIQQFPGNQLKEWRSWYEKHHPEALTSATDRVYDMVLNLREAIQKIDRNMVEKWVDDLVVVKTFVGLRFQEVILKKVAENLSENYRLSTPEEESKGIDGYIGNEPVSIKPGTYGAKTNLSEKIDVRIIFYEKKKDGLVVYSENIGK